MTLTQETQNPSTSVYGFADAATAFDERHPHWAAVMSRVAQICNLAFTRSQAMSEPVDKFVHFYGSFIAEDFFELFLMAANGYGFGAMKLLRSTYEHTVTLKYLHDNPTLSQKARKDGASGELFVSFKWRTADSSLRSG